MMASYDDDLILTDDDLKDIQKSLDDIKAGRVSTLEEVEKVLGLNYSK